VCLIILDRAKTMKKTIITAPTDSPWVVDHKFMDELDRLKIPKGEDFLLPSY